MSKQRTYCGFVAIVGRSNVGKSTLLNQLLGQKISITSRKPQTTRHRILGIKTESNYQIIYVDTPGLHTEEKRTINRLMNQTTSRSISCVDLIIFVVEGIYWTIDDEMVINKLHHLHHPVILVINKIDNIKNKIRLLPHIKFLSKQMAFLDIVPISAKKNVGIDIFTKIVREHLPEAPHHFQEDCITNCSQCFIAAEIIREKLIRFLGEELPYSVTVEIEQFIVNKKGNYSIHGLILVEKYGQKKIIIGNKGSKIKKISIEARIDMEKFFDAKVYLELWIKVKPRWTHDEHILRSLGYIDDLH